MCPETVLRACAVESGSLSVLDGSQLRPPTADWPAVALNAIAVLVTEALELAPQLLSISLWQRTDHLNLPVSELRLTTRSRNCLRKAGIARLGDLASLAWRDLICLRNLGVRSLLDIVCALEVFAVTADELESAAVRRTSHVLRVWTEITGIELSDDLKARFHAGADELSLATWPEEELRSAGSRVFATRGGLRLLEWADELVQAGTVLIETIPERWCDNPDTEAETLRQALTDLLTCVSDDRLREVMTQSFALAGAEARTLAEIGAELDLSGEWVRQLREKGLAQVLATVDEQPMARAVVRTLSRLVSSEEQADTTIIDVAMRVLPATPVRVSVSLITRLIGYARDERERLLKGLRHTLRRAARDQRTGYSRQVREQQRREQLAARFGGLRGEAWMAPTGPRRDSPAGNASARRRRRGRATYVLSSPKMARDIAAESTIELAFFQLCEACPDVVWYCEQPVALDYQFDGRARTYFPDAMSGLTDGRTMLVEVKNLMEVSHALNLAMWAAARLWCAARGMGFLVTDGRRTLHSVETHRPDPEHVQILAGCLKAGALSWLDLLDLRRKVGFSPADLTAAIVQEGWILRLAPWRLSLPGVQRIA